MALKLLILTNVTAICLSMYNHNEVNLFRIYEIDLVEPLSQLKLIFPLIFVYYYMKNST